MNSNILIDKIDLYYLAECLSDVLPDDSIFITDSGLEQIILPKNIKFKDTQKCIYSVSQGAMGYALPASIGAYYASMKPIITVIGDGSIMMNLQELATIKYKNIPIKIFVINNNGYDIIRQRQKDLFRRTIGTDTSDGVGIPDFKKLSEGFELPYFKIENNLNLRENLDLVIKMDGPILCEIIAIEDQFYEFS